MKNFACQKRKAFTLIELLVSAGIFAMVAVVGTVAIMNIFTARQKQMRDAVVLEGLRSGIELIGRDVRAAYYIGKDESNGGRNHLVLFDKDKNIIKRYDSDPVGGYVVDSSLPPGNQNRFNRLLLEKNPAAGTEALLSPQKTHLTNLIFNGIFNATCDPNDDCDEISSWSFDDSLVPYVYVSYELDYAPELSGKPKKVSALFTLRR